MLWLEDKLRPVERRVKGRPKNDEIIVKENSRMGLSIHTSFTYIHKGSTDFPRLFRIFCTRCCARFFPQSLRSDFAGISGRGCKEKWRKAGEICVLRKTVRRWPIAVGRTRFPRCDLWSCYTWNNSVVAG